MAEEELAAYKKGHSEYHKEWYKANKGKVAEYARNRPNKLTGKAVTEKLRSWQKANPERYAQYQRLYHIQYRKTEKWNAYMKEYSARKKRGE